MARARQEGSSPEPVEGLARDGPRPFPLSRLVPSAVSCGLCEPGLPAAPAAPALLPAAYLCAPTAPPTVTSTLGGPRWAGGPRSRPRGPRPDGECRPTPGTMGARRERDRGTGEVGAGGGRWRAGRATGRVWPVWSLCCKKQEDGVGGWGWGRPSGKSLLESDCSPRVAAQGLFRAWGNSCFPAPLP